MDTALRLALRGHKSPISCFCRHENDLVSADREGYIILWNLATKRPSAVWKAHEGHIVTLRNTAMGLLSHGRDSNIRIWDLRSQSIKKCSASASTIGSHNESKPNYEEIPVNSLNFCNVDFWDLDDGRALLATPATIDSDNFDVYIVKTSTELSIKRVVENFSVKSAKHAASGIEEINSPESVLQSRGHGIIMRLLFVAHNLLFVGYESGAVFGFKLEHNARDLSRKNDRLVIDAGFTVLIVASLLGHTPLPVLSLEYDQKRKILYCGSASKKLLQIDISAIVSGADSAVTNGKETKTELNPQSENPKRTQIPITTSATTSDSVPKSLLLAGLNKWGQSAKTLNEANTRKASSQIDPSNTEEQTCTQKKSQNVLKLDENQTYTNLKHAGIQTVQVTESGYVVSFWDGVTKAFTADSVPKLVLERAEESIQPLGNEDISSPSKKSLSMYAWTNEDRNQITSTNSSLAPSSRKSLALELLLFVGYGDGLIRGYSSQFP